jgi:hypothetical protein
LSPSKPVKKCQVIEATRPVLNGTIFFSNITTAAYKRTNLTRDNLKHANEYFTQIFTIETLDIFKLLKRQIA